MVYPPYEIIFNIKGFLVWVNSQIFSKKAGHMRMIMIIIVMRSGGTPTDHPESTTLLTLLPVFLSQPGAGFFFAW
ncbi:hypothetical protein FZI39_13175 [Cronobacter sakazakii]|nr:hypothetical protein FZI39_13175 [Cronobacter sakazakii]KAB1005848.1 hypothetical protein FZI53_17235 [Cronobacter sakazakii]KAB1018672.1 hypothetical protein FZI43_16615 [Cronobacter sakazakii]MDI9317484.1 hypothetical protein [Cronobacter sakazakii]